MIDDRLQALKPGDYVRWCTSDGLTSGEAFVVATYRDGVILDVYRGGQLPLVFFVPADHIVWPPAPKAEPGKVYRRKHAGLDFFYAWGTASGQLRMSVAPDEGEPFRFTPDWQLVEEEPS